jgi:hypothetical protein
MPADGASAPAAPEPVAAVPEASAPAEAEAAPEADVTTETPAEAEEAPVPVSKAKAAGKAKEEAPAAKEEKKPAEEQGGAGLSYDEFVRLAREKFIPNGHIATVARDMVEKGQLRQIGSIRELNDQERLSVFMVAQASMD